MCLFSKNNIKIWGFFFIWLVFDVVKSVKYGIWVMFLSSMLWTTLFCIYSLNMQKTFWFVSRFEHANFIIYEKYSTNNYDNANYYASLVIFRTYKNVVSKNVHSLGWLFWPCFYPIALICLKPWFLTLTPNNHVPIIIHMHMMQIIISHCIKNYNRANVTTLALGSQSKGLQRCGRRGLGSHISCYRECRKMWENERSHS
jgi:hypothetical protein